MISLVDRTVLIVVLEGSLFVIRVGIIHEVEEVTVLIATVTVCGEVGVVIAPPSLGKTIYFPFLVLTFLGANHNSERVSMPLGQNPL
jgi:hypothetical protein